MTESFVSLNIVNYKNRQLLNKQNTPLLFYYNGEENINKKLLSDKSFIEYISDVVGNETDYTSSLLSYFYFDNSTDEEQYKDTYINVQDLFTLETFSEERRLFSIYYVFNIFKELYENAMHVKYEQDIMVMSYEYIVDIYNKIQQKFPNKFIKSTVINYIRNELRKRYDLNEVNVNYLLTQLEKQIPDDK